MALAVAGFAGLAIEDDVGLTDDEISITESVTAGPAGSIPPTESGPGSAADAATLGPCTSVVYVGGSTSLGLLKEVYIADEDDQIPAQLSRVGVTTQHYEIAGGRSIMENYKDNPSAATSAQKWADDGYDGCWIFALGTNDVANVSVGAATSFDERIDAMMAVADGDPVLWINLRTVANSGAWRSELMPPWNATLAKACERYPNMRVYDWAAAAEDDWFEPDGIHNNPEGALVRSRNTADALAKAFPNPGAADAPVCTFGL